MNSESYHNPGQHFEFQLVIFAEFLPTPMHRFYVGGIQQTQNGSMFDPYKRYGLEKGLSYDIHSLL